MKLSRLLTGALIISLVGVGLIGSTYEISSAGQLKTASDYSALAGGFIKSHSDLLPKSIDTLDNQQIDSNNVIAMVGEVQLSNDEFLFRKGIRQASGMESTDDNEIYNVLIEEKMLINYGKEHNLLPTNDEINFFIAEEKNTYNTEVEYKKIVDSMCSAGGLSLDQYWNSYEYYNAYRVVAFKKVYDYTLNDALKMKKVKPLPSGQLTNSEIFKEHLDYYSQFKSDLKSKINVKVNDSYKSKGFTLDNSKNHI